MDWNLIYQNNERITNTGNLEFNRQSMTVAIMDAEGPWEYTEEITGRPFR